MQEIPQTPKNDAPHGTSPSKPDIPHFLRSKKAKVIGLTLLVVFSLLLTSAIALSKVRQKMQSAQPQSYEECLKAPGSKTQLSYPSVCVTSDGQRFVQPLSDEEQQNLQPPDDTSNWKTYTDDVFNISFEYPSDWKVQESIYPLDNYRGLEISHDKLGWITISREDNSEQLTPRQWFERNRGRYHPDLISEIGEVEIQGNQTLIIGQPDTCQTAPVIAGIVNHGEEIFVIAHFESGSRPAAVELSRLLETLSFNKSINTTQIPDNFFQFPQEPSGYICN